MLVEKNAVSRHPPVSGGARTTKSGLSGDRPERERTVGCADMVTEKVIRSKTPTPHHSRPVTPVSLGRVTTSPGHNVAMLSPETVLPPPPSPPCTCGKVLGDMGPAPDHDWTDNHSIDSKGTLESRRSQGYVSMNSASTYLIDATGADPVLVTPAVTYRDQYQDSGPMFGYPVEGGLMSHSGLNVSDRAPLCAPPMTRSRSRWCETHMKENCGCSLNKSIIKKVSRHPNQFQHNRGE